MAGKGRVALVTGGTRGIGEAIARRLAGDGFAVAISGRTKGSVGKAVERFRNDGIPIAGLAADARKEEEQEALVEWIGKDFGRLDVLVNNAGIGGFDSVEKIPPARFREIVETNLFGPYYAIHFAAPLMKKGGGGFIVNIASLAGINAFAGGAAYNASKFGLLGLSDAAMLDLRHDGVRIAVILPGSVATEFSHSHGSHEYSWMLSSEDVARAVSDLVKYPDRAIPSRLDLRPSHPPKR
ncbi:MAG TPA: SDR family oxidoreductase [Thermoanaerobaculia bacterium]|nr:SDR family oxidoreductase [Thermoanaerobaculia bacterium]